jgi:hypothetical protein
MITVALYDLTGKFVKNVSDAEQFASGDRSIRIRLSGVSQGAYLLAIGTDKGEQAIQRIIIQ